jgi:hypothetical protein
MEEPIWECTGGPGGTRQQPANALRRVCRALFFAALSVTLLAFSLMLSGCGRMEKASPVTRDDYAVTLAVDPAAPVVGDSQLAITLKDPAGQPVSDARLDVEANMSHAGMVPVSGQALGGAGGVYRVPIKWTMAGDWYVDAKFTLADGKVVARRFPAKVGGR